MKKPRSDSKLDGLDIDQQRQLCEWMLSGLSYDKIKKLVFDEFNVSTSGAPLSAFYQSYVAGYLIQHRAQVVGVAKEIGDEARRRPMEFSPATIEALEQKAFELASAPLVNPRDVKAIFMLVLRAQELALDRDKFEELKRQSQSAKETITNPKLSDAEKAKRIREILKVE